MFKLPNLLSKAMYSTTLTPPSRLFDILKGCVLFLSIFTKFICVNESHSDVFRSLWFFSSVVCAPSIPLLSSEQRTLYITVSTP